MAEYKERITKVVVLPEGKSIFCEMATEIEIIDEAAGEFLRLTQCREKGERQVIEINHEEWPTLKKAIEKMLWELRI